MIQVQSDLNALMRRSKNRGANITAITGHTWRKIRPVIFGLRRQGVRIVIHEVYELKPIWAFSHQPLGMTLGQ